MTTQVHHVYHNGGNLTPATAQVSAFVRQLIETQSIAPDVEWGKNVADPALPFCVVTEYASGLVHRFLLVQWVPVLASDRIGETGHHLVLTREIVRIQHG